MSADEPIPTSLFVPNTHSDYRLPLTAEDSRLLGGTGAAEAESFLARYPAHKPTPLRLLPALSAYFGVASIHVKDEGFRWGLGSFKALGGAYAVMRLTPEEAERRLGRHVDEEELLTDQVRSVAADLTFGCATDGNHGRSVAAGARAVGARAMIFVHEGVSSARIRAMESLGGQVVTVEGSYDDSVASAARECEANGWTVVSDTAWPGYERIPGLVMQGYTVLIREALGELQQPPTHVFVQAGVGGLAAAAAAHLELTLGKDRPRFIVVEPARAACLLESARAGRPLRIPAGEPTVMAMLECYEPSLIAWRILSRTADAFMTVDEQDAIDAMRRLAFPAPGDPAIVAGESGAVGLAGLTAALDGSDLRNWLGLGPDSRILLLNTEGATDPERYEELVGVPAAAISAMAS